MIDGLRIHIPHVSETGPFQKIDRFFLAPARPAGICPLSGALVVSLGGIWTRNASDRVNLHSKPCMRALLAGGEWEAVTRLTIRALATKLILSGRKLGLLLASLRTRLTLEPGQPSRLVDFGANSL
jgi:hypothetical protein